MNYGKFNLSRQRKKLSSRKDKIDHALGVNIMRLLMIGIICFMICSGALVFGLFRGILATTPDITEANIIPVGYATYIYDNEGNEIQKLNASTSNRTAVSIDSIPLDMQHAIVAIEDERFYEHNGIDIKGIVRAAVKGVASGFNFHEGASTLTQQLLKNNVFSNWTTENGLERIKRKVQEQYLALKLEKSLTEEGQDAKSVILENYLNTINLGAGTYGIQAAAKKYFNKNATELTLSECAVLAAIPQNPTRYNPITHPKKNATRRKKVLKNMLDQNYITQEEYDEALADKVYTRIKKAQKNASSEDSTYSYFVDAVIEQVLNDLQVQKGYTEVQAYNALYSGGLKIHTTQDSEIQAICDEEYNDPANFPTNSKVSLNWALTVENKDGEQQNYSREMLALYFKDKDPSFTLLFDSKEDAQAAVDEYKKHILKKHDTIVAESISFTMEPQSSMTIIDQETGYVKAIEGGRGQKTASLTLNRATDSTRQPGSTFKILAAYAPALEEGGMTLATEYTDEYYTYENGTQVRDWTGNSYMGDITIRKAIEQSVNVVAVKTLTDITPRVGYNMLLKFGFTTLVDGEKINGKIYSDVSQPLALGGITKGVTNLELTAAYATIANGGEYIQPTFYTTVTDSDGNVILEADQDKHEVISDSTAYLLTSAMEDVVAQGTGTNLQLDNGMSVAGKTGTTSDYNDLWFAGYTPYYTCVVWAGYDDNQKLSSEGGGRTYQQTLWRKIMNRIHENLFPRSFDMPASVTQDTVCTKSGLLASSYCSSTTTEYFARDSLPDETCDDCYYGWKRRREAAAEKKAAEEAAAAAKKAEEEAKAQEETTAANDTTADTPAANDTTTDVIDAGGE